MILYQRHIFQSWLQCIKVNRAFEHMVEVAVKIPKLLARGMQGNQLTFTTRRHMAHCALWASLLDLLDTTWSTFCPLHSWPNIWSKSTACSNLQSLLTARERRIQSSTPDAISLREICKSPKHIQHFSGTWKFFISRDSWNSCALQTCNHQFHIHAS